jgi:hypothetical protein
MPVAAVSVNALSFMLKETFASNLSFSVQAAGRLHNLGGLALSRTYASVTLVTAIIALIVLLSQRAVQHPSAKTAGWR